MLKSAKGTEIARVSMRAYSASILYKEDGTESIIRRLTE
jgi:hypothetical protein